jgi:hypothetical protein
VYAEEVRLLVTTASPIISAFDAVKAPPKINEEVVKTATSVFKTEIATELLATWFIPFGFLLVYFIS